MNQKKTQENQKKKANDSDLKRIVDETSVNIAGIATEVIEHGHKLDELERLIIRIRERMGL